MEDAHSVVIDLIDHGADLRSNRAVPSRHLGADLSYFAVFDGHAGARASNYMQEHFHQLLTSDCDELRSNPVEALNRAFTTIEENWLTLARSERFFDGTTAAVVLLDWANKCCTVGNVGDSEVVLASRGADGRANFSVLTEVHDPRRNESELARVCSAGGCLWHGRLGHPRFNPAAVSIGVSRAVGNLMFKDDFFTQGKTSGLAANPHIISIDFHRHDVKDRVLILGCDGLWGKVSYEKSVELAFAQLSAGDNAASISQGLVQLAVDSGSEDNITVLVVVC